MSQVKAVFYLPLRDNDGRDLTTEAEAVKTELYVGRLSHDRRQPVRG